MTATRAVSKRIVDSPDRDVHAVIGNDRLTSTPARPVCAKSGHLSATGKAQDWITVDPAVDPCYRIRMRVRRATSATFSPRLRW
jgi:hypothetical protein